MHYFVWAYKKKEYRTMERMDWTGCQTKNTIVQVGTVRMDTLLSVERPTKLDLKKLYSSGMGYNIVSKLSWGTSMNIAYTFQYF